MARQTKKRAAKKKKPDPAAERRLALRLLVLLAAATLLRELWLWLALVPVHFDEAQYWVYGEELDLGYYSKPPLVAWAIRLSTDIFGETLFGLRAFAPLLHFWTAWMIFLASRRLFDSATGAWAAAGYMLAPGVTVSSALITTDPVMMAGWSAALYALIRAMEAEPKRTAWGWWLVTGLGVGLGMMAKYTAIAFPLGGLGYALLSRDGPLRWRGPALAAGVALVALGPNLVWNALNGFATIGHLGENAAVGSELRPDKAAEFLGSQFGVIGPVFFAAILAAVIGLGWRGDWRLRLLVWLTAPLIVVMTVQGLLSHANPNWSAPAFVAGAILAAHWLAARGWRRLLQAQLWIGVAAALVLWTAGAVYSGWSKSLPRAADPFKKMRVGGPFCEHALAAMEAEGVEIILSDNRRLLSECMWEGDFGLASIAVFDPDGVPNNHYELKARLQPGDRRPMILAATSPNRAALIAAQFEAAEELDSGSFRTHSDREETFSIWRVEGFHGY